MDRSAWFATIVGKSPPESMRLTLGRDWSTRPILSLFIALRFLFLLKIENWQFAEPSKPRVSSRIIVKSCGEIIFNASCKQQRRLLVCHVMYIFGKI